MEKNKFLFDSNFFESKKACKETVVKYLHTVNVIHFATGSYLPRTHVKTEEFFSKMESLGYSQSSVGDAVYKIIKNCTVDDIILQYPDEDNRKYYYAVVLKKTVTFKKNDEEMTVNLYIKLFNVFRQQDAWMLQRRHIDTKGITYIDVHD